MSTQTIWIEHIQKFIVGQALRYYNHLNYFFQSDTVAVAKLIIHRGQIHGSALSSFSVVRVSS